MIIDGKTVIAGIINFTKATDDKISENLLVIRDKDLTVKCVENRKVHEGHS